MMIADEHIDIFVDEVLRGQHIGEKLFVSLIQRLQQKGFDRLVILGATSSTKGFYDAVLNKLNMKHAVRSFRSESRDIGQGIRDNLYEILI